MEQAISSTTGTAGGGRYRLTMAEDGAHACRDHARALSDILQALAEFERSPSLGLARCERAAMGFSHSEVGQALAEHWKFPPALCYAIGCESFPHPVGRNDESTLVAATVRLASLAVQRRRIGFVESPDNDGRDLDLAMQSLGIRPRGLELILDEVEKEIERMRDEGWL